uniref:Deoxynucleoside triphosphate triphosphohydrolase SAMHD1 (inferred by orthology to a human protein) n=1 Tax=Strongyloides venezuelensis TaxID=75913 RepID=A0A0K0G167_STRVS
MSQLRSTEDRSIDDCVHGFIPIGRLANLIIDTKYFDRTKEIHQTGMAKIVYPCAEHSRKTHMLGTFFLSLCVLEKLVKGQPNLKITKTDILCVSIAALCHDIGHGPYSHLYDGPFMNAVNKESNFKHEIASVEILKQIFQDYPDIKAEFDEYLEEEDYTFIYECINPKFPFMVDGKWLLKGRGKDKSFLYDIVSNVHTGIDVDRFDYFLRDSFFCSIKGSQFDVDVLHRIIDYSRVVYDSKLGYNRIGYAFKVKNCINAVFETRKFLFETLYFHKTCLSYEHVLLKAWIEADKYLEFRTKKGDKLKLSTLYKDWELYSLVTEHVVNALIQFYPDDRLSKSRELLDRLRNRKLPKAVFYLQDDKIDGMEEKFIKEWIMKNSTEILDEEKLFVKIRRIHSGKGIHKNPMDDVLFYNHKDIKNNNIVDEGTNYLEEK